MLNHGIQASRSPVTRTRKGLRGVELVFEVDLGLRLVVVEVRAIVEALNGGIYGGKKARCGNDRGGEAHL